MEYEHLDIFTNKILYPYKGDKALKPVAHPAVRYVKAEGKNPAPVRVEAPEENGPLKIEPSAVRAERPAPVKKSAAVQPEAAEDVSCSLRLDLNNENLLNGFIMSEILGRPKCFRRGRRPGGR